MGWTPNREELAWAAGFFDGEGTTYSNGRVPRVTVPQADIRPIERFHRAVGGVGKVVFVAPPKNFPSHKPQWHWTVTKFEHAQAVIAMLWPWLSEPKREQATGAFNTYGGGEAKWVCKRGLHPWSDGLIYYWRGRRGCLPCRREASKQSQRRLRAARAAEREATN
jgi:hypothetical protein